MKFDFVPPKKHTLPERRKIRRALQGKLLARAAAQLGKPVVGIFVDKTGACYASLKSGERVRFSPVEEEAWQAAVQWEQTGEGEVPRLPLGP